MIVTGIDLVAVCTSKTTHASIPHEQGSLGMKIAASRFVATLNRLSMLHS